MGTLIADSVTMVMFRLLSFMRGLNGLEAPFKMLACEEVDERVLTASYFQVCRERALEGWVSEAHPGFAKRKRRLEDHSSLAWLFPTNAGQLPLSPPYVTHKSTDLFCD